MTRPKPPTKREHRIEYRTLSGIRADPRNPKAHEVGVIDGSMRRFGFIEPIVVDDRTGMLISGHGRTETLTAMHAAGQDPPAGVRVAGDDWEVPVTVGWASVDDVEASGALIALNRAGELGGWVDEALLESLDELGSSGGGLEGIGYADDEVTALRLQLSIASDDSSSPTDWASSGGSSLVSRFVVPPFSVLNARAGYWQDRKRRWLDFGIQGEIGRDDHLLAGMGHSAGLMYKYQNGKENNRNPTWARGTSLFDPVLCEVAYRWFSPPDGHVLDPFAGGSVRGIVASLLGRSYTGIELRPEQVAANNKQADDLLPDGSPEVIWHTGDSAQILPTLGIKADLIFSCPPYADLEVYSDDPADLSNMPYHDFLTAYRVIIRDAVDHLHDDRFAVWVVGEVRDQATGMQRGFVPATIRAFEDAGAILYNEAVLTTQVSTLAIRTPKQFPVGRKLGRAHQSVLVFCKGNPKLAVEACGDITVEMPESVMAEAMADEQS